MSAELVLQRLRAFLLVMAGALCVGTMVELGLTEHWGSPPQILPFVLCGLGLIGSLAALLRPQRNNLRVLRWIMGITVAGSLFGVFEHIEHNLAFAQDIRPNAAANELILEALGGANPLLATGILALAAILAIAATYYHPALGDEGMTG